MQRVSYWAFALRSCVRFGPTLLRWILDSMKTKTTQSDIKAVFCLKKRSKGILFNLFQLLVLVTPLFATGLWAAHPYVERDLSPAPIEALQVPSKIPLQPVTQEVIQRSDGTKLIRVTINEQISVDATLGGQVRNRVDSPKERIPLDEPISTRTAASSHYVSKSNKRRMLQYLSLKAVLAILKLNKGLVAQ